MDDEKKGRKLLNGTEITIKAKEKQSANIVSKNNNIKPGIVVCTADVACWISFHSMDPPFVVHHRPGTYRIMMCCVRCKNELWIAIVLSFIFSSLSAETALRLLHRYRFQFLNTEATVVLILELRVEIINSTIK